MRNTEQASRYREIRRLGSGGMATVVLAEDTVLGRLVALKRVHGAGEQREMLRLKREALVGASLNHPNLVFVYDAQLQDDGDVVIIMEYVEGETLADVIGSAGALDPPEALRVLHGVAAALDAIHERGIVHRDVKPANVLLGHDGAIKLADLGVADVADRTRITTANAVVGSFSYMSAEQLDGAEPSPAMDVYALAAMAYEMLSGERARPESNPLALAHAIATQPPPDLRRAWRAAPRAAADVLRRAMSADPAQRPASAGALVSQLQSALRPSPAGRGPARPNPVAPPPPRRRRTPILIPALLGVAALAVAAVIVAALGSSGDKKRSVASKAARRSPAHQHRTPPSTTTAARSSATTPARTSATSPARTSATTPATQPATPAPAGASSATPVGAVEQFYTAAAQHRYSAAWALADANLQSELGGYTAFANQMSSVRSITFHRAQAVDGAGSDAATVALSTTSVQSDRTQQCTGTARTVRSDGAWLLDRVSVRCS